MSKSRKPSLDLSGMETEEQLLRKELTQSIPDGSSPVMLAIREAAISRMSSGAQLAAIYIMAMSKDGSLTSEVPYRRIQRMMGVGNSKMEAIMKEIASWKQMKITTGSGQRPTRYSLLMPAIDCGEKVLVPLPLGKDTKSSEAQPVVPPNQGQAVPPNQGHNTFSAPKSGALPYSLGGEGEGVVVVVGEEDAPKDGCGSGRELATTPSLPSQNPDLYNRDNAREFIGANASETSRVVVNCETIKGPGFVISIRAAEALAGTLGMPEGRGKALAEIEAYSWEAQGFAPDRPDKFVAAAIRKHVSQIAQVKAQVAAVSEPSAGSQKWGSLLTASGRTIDSPQRPVYVNARQAARDKAADEYEAFKARQRAKQKEEENG